MNISAILAASIACMPTDTVPASAPDTVSATARELGEVVVAVKKPVIKSTGDKLTYDVEQDKASKGATLLEALRRIPLVTVSGDDKITVNGSSSFQIYLNGKPNPMLTQNYSTVFKAMPADAVTRIEVITEPGAKYDAEGVGAILNLITVKEQKQDGYAGALSLMSSTRTPAITGMGSVKKGTIAVDGNVTYANSLFKPQTTFNNEEAVDNSTGERRLTEMSQKADFDLVRSSLNLTWEPSARNLFTVGGDLTSLAARCKDINSTVSLYRRGATTPFSSMRQSQNGKLDNLAASGNASFQHNFDKKGSNLVASYLFNFGSNPLHLYAENRDLLNPAVQLPVTANLQNNYTREHTGQLDYTLPLVGDKHLLETGGKMILRRNSTNSRSMVGPDFNNMTTIASNDIVMNQNQDVYAVYASYSATVDKWNAKAGLRYEHTRMGTESLRNASDRYSSQLNDLVPNAAVSYLFSPVTNLRLAYQMRIARPTLAQISPFRMQIVEGEEQLGNPDLQSERDHNYSLTYSSFLGIIGGRLGVSYSVTDNAVASYYFYEGDTRVSSFRNIGSKRNFSINPMFMVNLGLKFNAQLSGAASYVDLRAGELGNSGWTGNYNASITCALWGGVNLTAFGGQNFKSIEFQGTGTSFRFYGLSLNRNFAHGISVSLRAQNFMDEYSAFNTRKVVDNRTINTQGRYSARDFSVTFGWQFGNLRERRKTTAVKIENNDKIDAKSSGGVNVSM